VAEDIKKQDQDLWKQWNKTKDHGALSDLLKSMNPMIQKRVNAFEAAPVPRSAIEAEAKKLALKAFQTYDPNRGTQLNTHVGNYLQKVYRYVSGLQNVARIPEHRTMKIQTFKNVKASMESSKGREPTIDELSDELGWSPNEVSRIQTELRKDLSHFGSFGDTRFVDFDRTNETINFAYYELTPKQKLIFDYGVGANGKEKLSISQIATRLKMTEEDVIKARSEITNRIKERM